MPWWTRSEQRTSCGTRIPLACRELFGSSSSPRTSPVRTRVHRKRLHGRSVRGRTADRLSSAERPAGRIVRSVDRDDGCDWRRAPGRCRSSAWTLNPAGSRRRWVQNHAAVERPRSPPRWTRQNNLSTNRHQLGARRATRRRRAPSSFSRHGRMSSTNMRRCTSSDRRRISTRAHALGRVPFRPVSVSTAPTLLRRSEAPHD